MSAPTSQSFEPRPRVLFLVRELLCGGAAFLAVEHARQLADRYALDVLVAGPSEQGMVARLPAATRVFVLPGSSSSVAESPAELLRRNAHLPPFQTTYEAILATSLLPDGNVVGLGGDNPAGLPALRACAAFAVLRARFRMVFLVDESLSNYLALSPRDRCLVSSCIRLADVVAPVSARLWQRLAEACPPLRDRPWQRVFPPIDEAAVRASSQLPQTVIVPNGQPVVVTVARLVPGKQIDRCIQVHRQLKNADVQFRWYVVGGGPEEPDLREAIRRLGLEADFHLLGERDSPFPYLKAADLFVLFSRSEGCPTVIREALALGLPVLTTDVNGADELIEHDKTGLIVRNELGAMVAGLARMLKNDHCRKRLQQSVQERLLHSSEAGDPTLRSLIEAPPTAPPRVSILIPTYNQESFIGKAVASALAQDYPSLEVVVLDDASTDATESVARRFSHDPRFRYIRHPRNLGRVANYRHGVEQACGDWVLMLDGDDFLLDPAFLSRATTALARHADRPILFVQAGHRFHHPDGSRPDVDILPPIDEEERVVRGGEYLRLVFESGFFSHLGALYDRRAAQRIGFYQADLQSSDLECFFRLALDGEVLLLNAVTGCWTQHGENASSNLEMSDLLPNVRLFGEAARRAVSQGQATARELAAPLLRQERTTLLHLFGCVVRRSPPSFSSLAALLRIAGQVNPRLLVDRRFLGGVLGLVGPHLRRTLTQSRLIRRLVRWFRFPLSRG